MAATHRSIAIREEKDRMRCDIDFLVNRIRRACGSVPTSVLMGSANLAVAWRTAAEKAMTVNHEYPDSATADDLRRRIVVLNRTLSFLENPRID